MLVDRQMIAQTVRDLRVVLPEADDLLAGLHRWPKPPRRILEVDGAGLTLVQEDGRPRWVAATDAAMELLQQIQHEHRTHGRCSTPTPVAATGMAMVGGRPGLDRPSRTSDMPH